MKSLPEFKFFEESFGKTLTGEELFLDTKYRPVLHISNRPLSANISAFTFPLMPE